MKITDLLKVDGIKVGATAANQMDAIDQLVDLQVASGNINDRDKYKEGILAREAEFSTAVGDGIAIPHAKVAAVKQPGLAAMTVPGGVNWNAPDGEPADLMFMIAAPEGEANTHLEMLANLSAMLMHADFANAFDGWTTEAEGSALASGGEKEVMPIVRGLGNGTFDVSQTLSELPNGIYMATVNGMFRSGNEINSKFYAGQFYMNGTANYVMSPGDDVMSYDNAIPGENCLGDDGDAVYIDDHTEGYVLQAEHLGQQ